MIFCAEASHARLQCRKVCERSHGTGGEEGSTLVEIYRILKEKKPAYALLENVDRLLKSPTSQRGRDFAVMLASLDDIGYAVEWRSFSASDYGFPQRRKRVFILAYASGTIEHRHLSGEISALEWLERKEF